jgi:hypothetical protein
MTKNIYKKILLQSTVDAIGTPTYQMPKCLAGLLAPVGGHTGNPLSLLSQIPEA